MHIEAIFGAYRDIIIQISQTIAKAAYNFRMHYFYSAKTV